MNSWLKYSYFVCFKRDVILKGKSIYSDVNKNIKIWNHYTWIEPRTTLSFTRLSKVAKPIHYKILLRPNLVTYEFSGDETITIFVEETTSVIYVNSLNLTIDSIYAKRCGNKEYNDLRFEYLLDIEQIKIYFPEILYKENVDLRIRFHGKLSTDPFGFYLSFYHENPVHPDQKVLASTQFESSYARAAFPCFDEPNFKATFEISLQVHKDLTALSNAEIKGIDKMDDGTKKVNYESTIHMSTYLVAFVVGDIEYIEGITSNGKTRIRVYTVKERIHRADYALKVGVVAVDYLNKYFNMDYPLTKMDMVAIPFFNSGAMENTGLLLYRTDLLLVDKDGNNKIDIATVVSHEIAHQWFGNIITMNWWNQLWLKEGFASYFEYEVPMKSYPELNVEIYQLYNIFYAMGEDAFETTHAMDVPIDDKETLLDIYSHVSYQKGGAVIRMLREYVGRDAFRRSLQMYLKRHEYSNTVTEDLWKAFKDTTGRDVAYMMDTWSKQKGFPLVTISQEVRSDKRILRFKQRRFILDNTTLDESQVWNIPISVFLVSENARKQLYVMKNKEETFVMEDVDSSEILVINPEHIGFYRVLYSEDMFDQLCNAMRDRKLSLLNVRGIVDDTLALINAKELKGKHLIKILNATKYIENLELHFFFMEAINGLKGILLQFNDQESLKQLNSVLIQIYLPVLEKIGWGEQPDDTEERRILRYYFINLLKSLGYNFEDKKLFYDITKTIVEVMENTKLLKKLKDLSYRERSSFIFDNIKEYFEYIGDKEEITIYDLASLLKWYISPNISETVLRQYVHMKKPTHCMKNIYIEPKIYKNALKMVVSKERNSNNIQQVEKFLEMNTSIHTKESIQEQFKKIDHIDRTTYSSMKYFALSISSYLNSKKFSSLKM